MLKWIDIPPVWLAAFVVLAWLQTQSLQLGLSFGGQWAEVLAVVLAGAGVALAVLALREFQRHKTTPIPHLDADALIQSGVFRYTRNPIYLGDLLLLAAAILWWDAVPSLLLLPIFFFLLQARFIRPEENRLRSKFPEEFARYAATTRRWL